MLTRCKNPTGPHFVATTTRRTLSKCLRQRMTTVWCHGRHFSSKWPWPWPWFNPHPKWMHRAKVRRHSDLFWAATYAYSQVIPILRFVRGRRGPLFKLRNHPVQRLSRYALVIHSYHTSKPVQSQLHLPQMILMPTWNCQSTRATGNSRSESQKFPPLSVNIPPNSRYENTSYSMHPLWWRKVVKIVIFPN